MKKIAILRPFSKNDLDFLKEGLKEYYSLLIPPSFDEESLKKIINDADIGICNRISTEILDHAQNLTMIQVPGAGVDKFDFDYLKKKKIILCNSHTNTLFVAEYAIALLFSLLKKIHLHDALMRNGVWFKDEKTAESQFYYSDSIFNKTIGIYGFGHIGQKIVQFLSGFNVKFNVYDRYIENIDKDKYYSRNIEQTEWKKFLKESDVIFISAPLTDETKNSINAEAFKLLKKDALLINVSRAEIVNQKDLFQNLKMKQIGGAAFDVWYSDVYQDENGLKYPSRNYEFHKLKNMLLSPYRAAHIFQKNPPHLIGLVENLKIFAEKNLIVNQVDTMRQF